jgi:phosphocarrier protein HPr
VRSLAVPQWPSVNGKSIMGVMMLAAARGTTIKLETSGPDETEALGALVALIEDKFGEGE